MTKRRTLVGTGAGMIRLSYLFVLLALCPIAGVAADNIETGRPWYIQAGAYKHYSDDEKYEGPPIFAGIEYHKSSTLLFGLSVFNNSFGDASQYLYVGRNFHPSKTYPNLRIKLTGGVAHGYSDENQDVSPIRWGDSWILGIVPTLGYQGGRFGADLALLGDSGLLFLLGYSF